MSNGSLTDFAAWIGAVVAVLVLLWDIYKEMRSGARIRLKVVPNMRYLVNGKLTEDMHVAVTIVNEGDLPTTLTHLIVYMFDNRWRRLLRQPSLNGAVVMQRAHSPQLPYVLKPGELWQGEISQNQLQSHLQQYGEKLVYVAIAHASSTKECSVKLDVHKLVSKDDLDVLGD
jgi:hypothetical protein